MSTRTPHLQNLTKQVPRGAFFSRRASSTQLPCPLQPFYLPYSLPRLHLTIVSYHINMIKDMIDKQVLELKKLWSNKRQLTFQLLNLAMIVFSALMIWKGLMFATKVSF
jgi:hypothetical protein